MHLGSASVQHSALSYTLLHVVLVILKTISGNIHLERKLVRYVRIKNRSGEMKKGLKHIATRRPVVNMLLTLGNQTKAVAVNLANRQNFNYPLLLGRRPLIIFNIAVDPAKTFVATLKQPNKKIWKSK